MRVKSKRETESDRCHPSLLALFSRDSEGRLQGRAVFLVAGKVYELAKARGMGREIPTEWLLQDIRD